MTNSGSITCGGSCSASTPSDSLCAVPINGVCGSSKFSCASGSSSNSNVACQESYPRGYWNSWTCGGLDGGSDASCSTYQGCFTPDELVSTPFGKIKISELKVGDIVISYDEDLSIFVENEIDQVLIHDGINRPVNDFETFPILELITEVNGIQSTTKVTANHLYFSVKSQSYLPIGNFNIGDEIQSINGIGKIISKNKIDMQAIVYNLHMKSAPNNYLVNDVVVHNEKASIDTSLCGGSGTSGAYTKYSAPSCPTACGLGSSTQTGTVSCSYDSCTGSSTPNTRSCSATASCGPSYTGTWSKSSAPSCPTSCGLGSSTQTGTVTCSNSNCDPSTKPSANTRSCSATSSCTPNINCVGSWSSYGACITKSPDWSWAGCHGGCGWCNAKYQYRTYTITTAQSGTGSSCPYSNGATDSSYCTGSGHCSSFLEGTFVTLENGLKKEIQYIIVGDKLKGSQGTNIVEQLKFHPHTGLVYSINGMGYFVTAGHPFMTTEGWKAFDEILAMEINPTLEIGKLKLGDILITLNEEITLDNFESIEMSVPVYNFEVSGTHDYYADGYLVHNK
jgi:hypothetical protein